MDAETRQCAQCKTNFTVQPEDFEFYKKIDVPAPTWCPDCRAQRRMIFRNERNWHRVTCAATGKNVLSSIAPERGFTIYEQNYYKSDAWDPLSYGRDVDMQRPFLVQFLELFKAVPEPNLIQKNNVNSDYSNQSLNLKNCYFCAGVDTAEDSAYLFSTTLRAANSFDLHQCIDTEHSYELVNCSKSNRLRWSENCEGCMDSSFLYDCRNCSSCVGCVGLRSKQYCIFNQQYTKEEYQKEIEKLRLDTRSGIETARTRFEQLKKEVPRKYAAITNSQNAVGDVIMNSRNAFGFNIKNGSENVHYAYRVDHAKDIWDTMIAWNGGEMEYEAMSCSGQRIYCSGNIWGGFDIQYSYGCFDCNNIFGCVGLRNKSYCILNKQYLPEEYKALLPKIIEQMKNMPYKDARGLEYGYGEFFPPEFSPFPYNESIAQDYYPLTQAEAEKMGFPWRAPDERTYKITMPPQRIPDAIGEVADSILNEVLACEHAGKCAEQCAGAFKLIPLEVQFYKQFGVPLPTLCPNCRHYARVKQLNPMKLYAGTCRCALAQHPHGIAGCKNTFMTPYAPERPETIYCETCYNAEIV
jgi:hypothetical protein